MATALKTDTLAYQIGVRPLVQQIDMSANRLHAVIDSMNHFFGYSDVGDAINVGWSEPKQAYPEEDALTFYMMNHAVSLVRKKVGVYSPLGKYLPMVEHYHNQLAIKSTRMFFYLLLICTRESRHEKTDYHSPLWTGLQSKYGAKVINFHQKIKGTGSDSAAQRLRDSPPDVPVGVYTAFLSEVFHTGKYSGGFGGKAWADVADCLHAFVTGAYSAEMMMDTAFTLCHNNGPIFNKGMLFHCYGDDIYKILDVQRSGQIPQLVLEGTVTSSSSTRVAKLYNLCRDLIGAEFEGHVDWFQVEILGALKTYTSEQKNQVQKYGYPPNLKAMKEAQAAKEAAELAKKIEAENKALAEKKSKYFKVTPKLEVKITTRPDHV